jgi:hypothetical protein
VVEPGTQSQNEFAAELESDRLANSRLLSKTMIATIALIASIRGTPSSGLIALNTKNMKITPAMPAAISIGSDKPMMHLPI